VRKPDTFRQKKISNQKIRSRWSAFYEEDYIIDKEEMIAHVFEKVNSNGYSREVLRKVKQLSLI